MENGKLFKNFSFNKNVEWEKRKRFPPFSVFGTKIVPYDF